MSETKYISIEEFREAGYLQEANRLFFHPLGLGLTVAMNDEDGSMTLCGVQDNRDDPEGMLFDEYDKVKAERIWMERESKIEARIRLGCCTQMGIQNGSFDFDKHGDENE